MHHYQSKNLSPKQNYKFLTGSVIPRPIAWLTTLNQEKQLVNAAPFSYFNIVSKDLPLVSLSINRRKGQPKDTAANLLANGEGVIHLVNQELLAAMNQTAAELTPDESELAKTDLTLIASHSVAVPAIAEAAIRMEIKVHQYLPIFDSQQTIISDFFLLEVTDYYFSEEVFDVEKEYILAKTFDPVARLAGDSYSFLGEMTDLLRPK
ncbi:flavin reductase (DIM6/NTAB) family NADH-FMN oxidoreductase RutF [Enterococcus sp. PF1-24]|uniref:flavin reductase family protein n=1 Tax=unclassified Enterococcus TaxID=2608891 RepID=UPI0024734037|nr:MULTISPECIES: flavin reductase family protein [unclassified Enterococcus]MDH6365678.1 flavin reductase (DIM6/NTAB) family NADH-FMN oxidoreductase RutF [Enterococcus sp. PFB1-1]MDH6402779.1 flavin reductase (DIM6/NTAB) family NADH-FMN oxidoreductase RutF [Enterococcus sp. PF1-24]